MNIRIGAHVEATDGRVGEVTRIVVEARDRKLTNIVVREGRFSTERLVPIGDVAEATSERVKLRLTHADFRLLNPFSRTVSYTEGGNMDPYLGQVGHAVDIDRLDLAEDEMAFKGGERVEATDGAVGRADEVIIDPSTEVVTHIVMREGHLWHTRTVTIPVNHVDHVDRNTIYLDVTKAEVEPMAAGTEA
jgi:uncharacterized protein YrrD